MPSPWVTRALTNDLPAKDLTHHPLITTTTTPPNAWDRDIDSNGWDSNRADIEAWLTDRQPDPTISDLVWSQE